MSTNSGELRILDGLYLRIRGLGAEKRPLVAVLGIAPEGQPELLALRLCYSENSVEVEGLPAPLRSLLTTTSVPEGFFSQLRKRLNPIGALRSPRAAERFTLAALRMRWISIPGIMPDQPLLQSTHKC